MTGCLHRKVGEDSEYSQLQSLQARLAEERIQSVQ